MKQETLTEAVGAALLQSRTDAIIVADLRGAILLWNPGAEQLFGYPAADALGQSLDIIIPDRLRTRHWDGFHHSAQRILLPTAYQRIFRRWPRLATTLMGGESTCRLSPPNR
jgi:PAS domain S-box-containing protein